RALDRLLEPCPGRPYGGGPDVGHGRLGPHRARRRVALGDGRRLGAPEPHAVAVTADEHGVRLGYGALGLTRRRVRARRFAAIRSHLLGPDAAVCDGDTAKGRLAAALPD